MRVRYRNAYINHSAVKHANDYSHKHINAHRHSSNSHANVYFHDYTYGHPDYRYTNKHASSKCNTYHMHIAISGCAGG